MNEKQITNIAMIPARIGSERLKKKNLALLNDKPMICYAIEAAKQSGVFDRIVINSDDCIFREIAEMTGVEFYLRPKNLGGSEIKSDHVVYDFIQKYPASIVTWVNSVSPLQTSDEIKAAVIYFMENNCDSLFTVENKLVHSCYEDRPLNFRIDEPFAKTQDLIPVQNFVYSVMVWNTSLFQEKMEQDGHAFFIGNVGYYPVSKESAILIKTKEDFLLAERVIHSRLKKGNKIDYYA